MAVPEMSVLEWLRIIKKRYPDMGVLIITEHEKEYSKSKMVQVGASDLLVKPFSREQLAAQLYKIERERALRNRLSSSSITDELTGLNNRRCFYRQLKQEMKRAKRQK